MIQRLMCRLALAACFAVTGARVAHAQSADNVAVVINDASQASVRIGEYYVRSRGIPAANVIRLKTSDQEEITRAVFAATIEAPIGNALTRGGLQDRVHYIVLTKGVPLRVAGTAGLDGTVASVDSELTLLYRKMTGGDPVPARGTVANPYYLASRGIGEAQRFSHRSHDIFLVSRLDAFTVDEAIAMIDRARAPVAEGRIVLDQRGTFGNQTGDEWLAEAARRLKALGLGDRVVLDSARAAARGLSSVIGYYGWGSNDPSNMVRRVEMAFNPGALAATFVSTDARTLLPPPDKWVPSGEWSNKAALFAGSPQTLIGDFIREGATGVAGHVAEPYLQSTVRPQILLPAYVSGFNLIESFYLAIPHLSWQTVVIGDPLCNPFPRKALTQAELDEGPDPETELPKAFSKRRLEALQRAFKGAASEALAKVLLAEARFAKMDSAGARRALEQATKISPSFVAAQVQLAGIEEQAGEHASAMERYRLIVKEDPNHVVALNNLAYGLAVRQNAPAEAKPLAQRAFTLSKGSAVVADTLAWIEHLLGNHADAGKLIAATAKALPGNSEVRLHAAFIFAALKDMTTADMELKAALKLDPALAKRADVQKLQAAIAGGAGQEPERATAALLKRSGCPWRPPARASVSALSRAPLARVRGLPWPGTPAPGGSGTMLRSDPFRPQP